MMIDRRPLAPLLVLVVTVNPQAGPSMAPSWPRMRAVAPQTRRPFAG